MQLPLNVSPVSASFIGIQHLGIHLVLCVACSLSVCLSLRYVFLCFNSCLIALSKIEDSSYSVVHVPLSGDNCLSLTTQEWKTIRSLFASLVSDRPGMEFRRTLCP
jgi:hypothetical protein